MKEKYEGATCYTQAWWEESGREEGAGGMKREERERGKKRIEEKVDE